jgi:hypothetical protein
MPLTPKPEQRRERERGAEGKRNQSAPLAANRELAQDRKRILGRNLVASFGVWIAGEKKNSRFTKVCRKK